MSDFTFTIVKPEVVKKGLFIEILDIIVKKGFRISAMKFYHLRPDEARRFYLVHKDRPFYDELVSYMSSGPVVVAVLEKENAVSGFRSIIGNTDPLKADEGTIRRQYGSNISFNAIHGSDSDENALIESQFFFSELERF